MYQMAYLPILPGTAAARPPARHQERVGSRGLRNPTRTYTYICIKKGIQLLLSVSALILMWGKCRDDFFGSGILPMRRVPRVIQSRQTYHAAYKVAYQPLNRSESQLTSSSLPVIHEILHRVFLFRLHRL